MSDEELLKESNSEEKDNSNSYIIFPIILGIISLPSLIIASLFWLIVFKIMKSKLSMTTLITLISLFIYSLIWVIVKPYSGIESITVGNILKPYLFTGIGFGIILGYIIILSFMWRLKKHPELRLMNGWAKDFKYSETPFEKHKKNKLIEGCKDGSYNSETAAPMGILEEPIELSDGKEYYKPHLVSRSYSEAYKGTLLTGATGSGKTISMLNLMYNDIVSGIPICCIDFKKGPDIAYLLSKWAKENNREFYHFTSGAVGTYKNPYCSHQASYDPLSTGSTQSKSDMMLNLRKWDSASEVYKGRTQSILMAIFYLLEESDKTKLPKIPWDEGGLAQFVAALDTPNLFDMIEQLKKKFSERKVSSAEQKQLNNLIGLYNELTSGSKSILREQMEGLVITCRTLIMSNYADWLAKGETPYHINLLDIVTSDNAPIVLFQFNPNEEPDFSKHMGSIILSDLSRVSAIKNAKGNTTPFGLYIDEFQTLDPKSVTGLLEKARSAKFFTTLSSQSLEQIATSSDRNGEETIKSIIDTVGNFIIHNGSAEDSAIRFSKILGKTKKLNVKFGSKRNSSLLSFNFGNSRKANVMSDWKEEYKVPPEKFQELSAPEEDNGYKSTAYYITKGCSDKNLFKISNGGAIARKMHVIPNNSVLESVPEDFKENLLLGRKPIRKIKQTKNHNITQQKPLETNEKIDIVEDISNNKITRKPLNSRFKQKTTSLDENTITLMKQSQLTDKEYSNSNKREKLEKKRKVSKFHQAHQKKVSNNISKSSPGGLPNLEDI